MKDLHNKLSTPVVSIAISAKTTGTINGATVDLYQAGLPVEACELLWNVGTVTDGTHVPKLQESADNSVWTDVAAADQIGTLANLATGVQQRVGYIGAKRYVRAVSTVSGTTTGGIYGASAVFGIARHLPLA